ncbi:hypothetical protein JRQ81_013426 [Phrynocephalus forsythii]|uniref:Melanoma antigen recognized by T-cells 1 n=1 Tax=Phrynocephalus forsythii TaxID=171643 RepID=A0A9Q0XZ42_9SAUR|nr:hypothetical protein JRQ81_013426 [Phrynocephalus forsythii]
MPRGDHNFSGSFGGGKRYSSLSAEEAAGIGILVVVLAVLVIIGWWYYKKRSGYKSIMSKNFGMVTMKTAEGKSALLGSRFPLQENNSNCYPVVRKWLLVTCSLSTPTRVHTSA